MKSLGMIFSFLLATGSVASAETSFIEACKAECPEAKTKHETHKCMKGVAKKKKGDKEFKASTCYVALQDHEAHEKKHGHKH